MTPAADRLKALRQFQDLRSSGVPVDEAATLAGASAATLYRWAAAYQAGGIAELEPGKSSGRKARAEAEELGDEVTGYLRRIALKTGSERRAIRLLADQAFCPEGLREYILERARSRCGTYAPSLHKACKTPAVMAAVLRGKKATGYAGFQGRRNGNELLADGTAKPVMAGDWWEFDDMSWNQPFWFELPPGIKAEETVFPSLDDERLAWAKQRGITRVGTGDKLALKHGVAMGRQSLMAQDVRSGMWLGVEMIGRGKDAYRAEDILRFMHRLFQDHGLPRRGIRLERGVWMSRMIAGSATPVEGFAPEEDAVFNGIRDLGIEVVYCFTTGQKGHIETGFKNLQSAAAGILEHWPDIGGKRGEMEGPTRAMLRCKAGVTHPQQAGFPHIRQLRAEAAKVMEWCNGEMKNGAIQHGIPRDVWNESIAAAPLADLPADKEFVFMPNQAEITLRDGAAPVQVDGVKMRFCDQQVFPLLGDGYRVALRFDPLAPEKGAWVFNREQGARDFHGHGRNGLICQAAHLPDTPLFGGQYVKADSHPRREQKKALEAAYAATGLVGGKKRDTSRSVEKPEHESVTIPLDGKEDQHGSQRPKAEPFDRLRLLMEETA